MKKRKIALDFNQMKSLEKLGFNTKFDSSMCYENEDCIPESKIIHYVNDIVGYRKGITFAYTLPDLLNKLPDTINYKGKDYGLVLNMRRKTLGYINSDGEAHEEYITEEQEEIDAAYNMLCWIVRQDIFTPC